MPSAGYALFPKDRSLTVADGTRIAYTVRGAGERVPVVLVNGWSCSDAYWAEVLPYLDGRGHLVVLPDTRGHGESGLPRPKGFMARNITDADMSLARVADDIAEVCAHAGVDRAVLVGHSMGVQTILEVHRRHPRLTAGLVAVAGAYENPLRTFYGQSFTDALWPAGKVVVGAIPDPVLTLLRAVGDNPRLGHRLARLIGAVGPHATAHRLAPYISHLVSCDPRILFKLVGSMRESSAADVLADLDVPLLVCAGALDPFTPPRVQKRMHELAPGSEIVWFDEAGHCLPVEVPALLCASIADFIDRRVAPSTGAAGRPRPASQRGA